MNSSTAPARPESSFGPSPESRHFPAAAGAVAFPLGGIGTGTISLGARGEFRDWEIFNRPAKGQRIPNAFWAISVWSDQGERVSRVLEAEITGPHTGSHGYHPTTAAGLPRFRDSVFVGEYPFAWVRLIDPDLPVAVELEAFTPFVPLNPEDSGLPCAVLTFRLTNRIGREVTASVVGSMMNPIGGIELDQFGNPRSETGGGLNVAVDDATIRGLLFKSTLLSASDLKYGDMCLVTAEDQVSLKPVWLRGSWFDDLRDFWREFTTETGLRDLGLRDSARVGRPDTGSVAVRCALGPGESKTLRFLLGWYFPNRRASWHDGHDAPLARNHYSLRFSSSLEVARYFFDRADQLERSTRDFHRAIFASQLPQDVKETIACNIVPIRSNTCFWLASDEFLGYEGCFDSAGCCAGTCTHVWSYAYTLASLFPSLERRMRVMEFCEVLEPDGYLPFRAYARFKEESLWQEWEPVVARSDGRPVAAVDGQLGAIVRVYREWLASGDRDWLRSVWPGVKRALAFIRRQWDPDGEGILLGLQHTTYDVALAGANPLCSVYYLTTLAAVAKLADAMAEPELAEECRTVLHRGSRSVRARLWNGDYFGQIMPSGASLQAQVGDGCLTDQLLGQLHAHALGLGYVLPRKYVVHAASAVARWNFRAHVRTLSNASRCFVLNDEAGLVNCTWPRGSRPRFPFPYADEVWSGSEYAFAALLIYEGRWSRARQILAAVRQRYDGFKRNPWDEVECGHHYVRSMSSWCLALALLGFNCDAERGMLSFNPILGASANPEEFSAPWFTQRAWGMYQQKFDPGMQAWIPTVQVLGGSADGMYVTACGQSYVIENGSLQMATRD